MPGIDEAAAGLASRHGLDVTPELERLIDTLFGLSCRDQEESDTDPKKMAQRRREGHALAKKMVASASNMLKALETLHTAINRFDEVTRSNPGLLESIFDCDVGGPGNLLLPDGLAILQTCFRSELDDIADNIREADDLAAEAFCSAVPFKPCPPGFWEEVDNRLAAIIALPVRKKLTPGPVPNIVLRSALRRLRLYWEGFAGRGWAMSSLRHKETREENNRDTLTGLCECFVVDALEVGEIRFSLPELVSAWIKLDAEAAGS